MLRNAASANGSRMRGALNQRAAMSVRAEQITGHRYRVLGRTELAPLVATTVEVEYDVQFPVSFIEIPSISGGGSFVEGQSPVAGQYPYVLPFFISYTYLERPGGTRVYTGGRLSFVASAHEGARLIADWQAEGRALVNPNRAMMETLLNG